MIGIIEFLVENPILLVALLLIVAVFLFAVIKKLLKLLAIATIAGILYVLLVNYVGSRLGLRQLDIVSDQKVSNLVTLNPSLQYFGLN